MNTSFSQEELIKIARSQKAILSLILLNLILVLCILSVLVVTGTDNKTAASVISLTRYVSFVLSVVGVVFIFQLAKALRRTAWVYALAALFPCIGLITLLLINHHATQTLRNNGVRVGLLGALKSDITNISR